ncbi:MAG: hypothetical protein QOC61_1156 [Acidobacteriota bacterium]|jgi:hypothetical protein|nr:hypothetical protein [Acidobacteriota bacterium]MDT5262152.1 hypothetical protein [Acidobacteriota bacterium]MDT7779663.1 hypothetical protein [Acidobacteriota bacterium]
MCPHTGDFPRTGKDTRTGGKFTRTRTSLLRTAVVFSPH